MAIAGKEYVRKRITPIVSDDIYIINHDLLAAIKALIPAVSMKTIDFGAGGAPYECLFKGQYDKADIKKYSGISINIDDTGKLPVKSESYDFVFSSQVLEHVDDPRAYLNECFRVLRPGGNLLISTHGIYEDHPCPEDLWRWTSTGLEKLLRAADFDIRRILKATCGVRAVLFLWQQQTHRVHLPMPSVFSPKEIIIYLTLKLLRFFVGRNLNAFSDWWLNRDAVREGNDPAARLYINIVILAQKPCS